MDDWFTVEKLDDVTFAISEYKHWEKMHSYLLIGKEYSLLIDTGLGISKINPVVRSLTDRPIWVVTSHVHWDHIGGHKEFETHYVHEMDAEWMKNGIPIPLEIIKSNVVREVEKFPNGFNIEHYSVFKTESYSSIRDGYNFELGDREIEVIHTPGHSPGHICLYDKKRKYLFAGDLIYKGTLYANYPSTDPQLFSQSVKRIAKLDIDRVFPAHNELNIPSNIIQEIELGFEVIEKKSGLKHGGGLFKFNNFSILI